MKKLNIRKLKLIPHFTTEKEERKFWASHDSTDYMSWEKAIKNPSFSQLKPSTCTISLRLPQSLLSEIKRIANKEDVPYQSLMKMLLAEKIKEVA